MSYTIYHSSGTAQPIVIADGQKNTSTSLTLVGRNYPNYGSFLNQNFLYMLENFANGSKPTNPITGQLWYNTSIGNGVLQICYDNNNFKNIGSATSAAFPGPSTTTSTIGDLWWDTTNSILNCYGGLAAGWVPIGPLSGTAQARSRTINYSGGSTSVLSLQVNNVDYVIISPMAMTITPIAPTTIPGFPTLSPGLNLINSATLTNSRLWGQANDSAQLGGIAAAYYLQNQGNQTMSGTLSINNNQGLLVGATNKGQLNYLTNDFLIDNTTNGGNTRLRTYSGGSPIDILDILGNTATVVNYDLIVAGNISLTNGSTTLKITGSNPSYNTTTGALQVVGGTGIGGNINVGGSTNNFSGNINAPYVNVSSNLAASSVLAQNIGNAGTLYTGTLINNSQPFVTSLGTLTTLSVAGNIGAGNLSATVISGTLSTNSQTSINTVGTLTGLSVTGSSYFYGANNYLGSGGTITSPGNVSIGGGSNTQVLTTWGNGSTYWSSIVVFNTVVKNGSVGQIPVYDSTQTTAGSANLTYSASVLYVNGAINATGDVTAYYSSDSRLKTNVKNIDNALEKVSQINGVTFDWIDPERKGTEAGVIAQEIQAVLPEVVTERDDGYLAVRYEKLVPLLIEAIKDLRAELAEVKSKV
jgi:hypothetical protein